MLETRQTYRKIGYLIVTPMVFLCDEDGEVLNIEPGQQFPVYRPFGLNAEEAARKKSRELEETR